MKYRFNVIATILTATAIAGCSQEVPSEEPTGSTGVTTQGLSIQALPKPQGAVLAQIPATPETIGETGGLVQAWQVYPYRSTMRDADQVAAVGAYVVGIDAGGGVHAVIRARSMSSASNAVEVASLTGELGEKALIVQTNTSGYGVVTPAASTVAARAARDLPAYKPPPYRDPADYCPPGKRCVPRDGSEHRAAEMGLAAVKIGISAAQLVAKKGLDARAWVELGTGIVELVVAEGSIPDAFAKTNWNYEYNQALNAIGLGKDPFAVLYKDEAFMASIGVNIADPWAFSPPSVVDSFGLPLTFAVQSGMISESTGSLFTSGINNPSWADTGGSLGTGFFDFGSSGFGSWGDFGGGGGGGGSKFMCMAF